MKFFSQQHTIPYAQIVKTILIVGDDRGLIRFMQIQLKQLGYETFMGMGGKRAIDMAVKELPDLITLDIKRP